MSVPATRENKPFYEHFQSEALRRVFEKAARDTPPEAVAVEPDRSPELTDGAAERVLELA